MRDIGFFDDIRYTTHLAANRYQYQYIHFLILIVHLKAKFNGQTAMKHLLIHLLDFFNLHSDQVDKVDMSLPIKSFSKVRKSPK